jgi:nicotinamide-nucleotide amidase
LDVEPELLSHEGAVSEAVALAMARGARTRLGADLALSTTGIAGPGGGSELKPVGTVWIAIADAAGETAQRLQLGQDRESNRRASVAAALDLLRLRLCDGRLDQ